MLVVPVVLPALVATFIVTAARFDLVLQRVFSLASTAALLAVALGLWLLAGDGVPRSYRLGDWPAPFGIVLVLDRLSALMLLLTSVLAMLVALYAAASFWDRRGRHFHALFQFQLMGLNGAFLTGDIFNLFVFFEVLLIASYGLVLHGAGARRITEGLKYVAVNLAGSTLFLLAVGLLYAVTGTLNMADLALRVPTVPEADQALLRLSAVLLLVVFAIKGALVPLHFWLPGTYAAASPPVAALFAIMTKVGAYAILRVYILVFGDAAGAAARIALPFVLPAAALTLVVGMTGVLASRSLTALAVWALVGSVGMLLLPLGLLTEAGTAAGLYYLVHSTLTGAALFLLADLVARRRGAAGDGLVAAPGFVEADLLGGLFFLAAIAAVGLPPLSGFIGKLLILQVLAAHPARTVLWATILVTSLAALVGFVRAGSTVFWKREPAAAEPSHGPGDRAALCAAAALVAAPMLLAAFAGPTIATMEATARQLFTPSVYIEAVLGPARLADEGTIQ
ncbi:monovalent cation/H+ antiporter subunit D [Geminicoccaceae bacterium SYSU G07066]|uniref:Monovalent cation/H+ antiporter subunit D n=2 Tax=Benzoatithermus flavus TaxID=3108223 RepID=A0ABU8XMH8_9PROT